jgi:hypothetical protein
MSAAKNFSLPTEIYDCESVSELVRNSVVFPELASFSTGLRRLRSRLGDEAHQDYWRAFLRPLFRYVFVISSTPLSTNNAVFDHIGLIERLIVHLSRISLIYPSFAEESHTLLNSFRQIVPHGLNPLLLSIEGLTDSDSETQLLVHEMRFAKQIEETLQSRDLQTISPVSSNQLRGESCYDSLIILGKPSWYPEYVFSAPRARTIHVVTYSWLSSKLRIEPAFVTHSREHSLSRISEIQEEHEDEGAFEDELLTEVDLDALSEKISTGYNVEHEYDVADALLLSLEGGSFVFIEAGEKSKVLIIDPDGESRASSGKTTSRVQRIPVSYVEPGTYVLLRTGAGGDYIIVLADRLLGRNASYVRSTQEHWKEMLRQEVNKRGLFAVSVALLDMGSIRAQEPNLRNWISRKNIRPEDKRDFTAILKLTGLESKLDEYWRNAQALTRAHLRAGAHSRRFLLTQVAKADLHELERAGTMVFELPEIDAGSMAAYRVMSISHVTQKVPIVKLEQPFKNEDELWHV